MTKDENELLKISKPLKWRLIRKLWQQFEEYSEYLIEKGKLFFLDLGVLLHLVDHKKRYEESSTDWKVVTKNAGVITTRNLQFTLQVNKCYEEILHLDIYKKGSKILKDLSITEKRIRYTAFPIDIKLRLDGDKYFLLKEDFVFTVSPKLSMVSSYNENEVNKPIRYRIDMSKIRSICCNRVIGDYDYLEGELINAENELIKDLVYKVDEYMKTAFKFSEALEKV